MNALIDLLEFLSGNILPWFLVIFALLLAIVFAIHALRSRQSENSLSTGGIGNMSRNQNSSQSDATLTTSELKKTWACNRNYDDTLDAGPIVEQPFAGWFAEEKELCEDFATAKRDLMTKKPERLKEHPQISERYLAIVDESNRKPHSLLIYVGLFLLMAVEATGFSLIFADRLSDTATAQAIQQYAVGIAIAIAVFALFFADIVGKAVYCQEYAHTAHLHSRSGKGGLERSVKEVLNIGQEDSDKGDHQSVRIVNRSNYVHKAAAPVQKTNRLIPRFPKKLWIYVAGVVAFGMMIGWVRMGQIDEFYAKEAQERAVIASSESAAPSRGNLSIPPGISQSKAETSEAISQEALDKEKHGKQLAIGVFIMIFFLAQTLGVVLAAMRGFASDQGERAFKAIKAFREKHGDISFDRWDAMIQSAIDGADRDCQKLLAGWQLGLQTAFTDRAKNVPNEVYFKQCVSDFSHRTYAAYVQLKQHAAQAAQTIAPMPHVTPQYAPPVQPEPQYVPPQQYAQPATQYIPQQQAVPSGVTIEFFVTTSAGGEQVQRCLLAEFQRRILSGQFPNLAALNVRNAGQPEAFVPWSEFAKRGIQA